MNSQPMNIAEMDMNTYYIIMTVKQVQILWLMQKKNVNYNQVAQRSIQHLAQYNKWYL